MFDSTSQNLFECIDHWLKLLCLKSKFALFSERFNPYTNLISHFWIVLFNLMQNLLSFLLITKFRADLLEFLLVAFYLCFLIDYCLLSDYCLLEFLIRIFEWHFKLFDSMTWKLLFKSLCFLPIEYVCLFDHCVDIILNVSDQGDLMYIQFLEKINKLFLYSEIQIPYDFFLLMSSNFKVSHSLSDCL